MEEKVYYSEKNIRLYLGDCFKILKNIPDNTFDMIFADPPYAESADFFAKLLNNEYFRKTLAGAKLFWELPDTPGSAGKFITVTTLADMKLRRFGSTTFLTGVIK